ncbi:MAG: hypothetical protein GVY19_13925 [Bacteroidetes bacterium]|jgi:alpha-glucosidase|nr:hypothetical protein [Bacteroidota bacterium]
MKKEIDKKYPMNALAFLSFLLLLGTLYSCKNDRFSHVIQSPDNSIKLMLRQIDGEGVEYSIVKDTTTLFDWSGLGMTTRQGGTFSNDLQVKGVSVNTVDTSIRKIYHPDVQLSDQYTRVKLSLQEKNDQQRKFDLIFRVYNEGVAFRYVFPGDKNGERIEIVSEHSQFNFTGNYSCLAQHIPHFNWSYERPFDAIKLNDIYGEPRFSETVVQNVYGVQFPTAWFRKKLIGLPLVVNYPNNITVAITETELSDYSAMYLHKPHTDRPEFVSRLAPMPYENALAVKAAPPLQTPWRVLMIGEGPGDLMTSELLQKLSSGSKITDQSWIKPGVAAWDFMAGRSVKGVDFVGGMNMETLKYYIDFAAEYKFDYSVIDWGWTKVDAEWYKESPDIDLTEPKENIDIEALAAYADQRDVGLFIWARWDNVRDQMEEAFETFQKWGVAGVKIDFMESDDQNMVQWYEKCLATAANYELLINFHGAYKPAGLHYNYPNYVTQEAVQGLEWVNMCDYIDPAHNVSLAFSRNLIGPMDYTPGGFNNVTVDEFKLGSFHVLGTRAHQLALSVIFNSPLLVLADAPHVYRQSRAADFYKNLVTTWDKTVVLDSRFNQYLIKARKNGDTWYLGGITNWHERQLTFDLDFLGDSKQYQLVLYKDAPNAGENPKNIKVVTQTVDKTTEITVDMASGGGFAGYLKPMK